MIGDAECVSASGSGPSQYRALVDRCLRLEAGHAELRGQLSELVESSGGEEEAARAAGATSDSEDPPPSLSGLVPGFFRGGSPYKRILETIGHAVHVCRASSEEIVYWNRSAEDLYGWKDYEVIGRQINELLVAQEFYPSLQNIMEKLRSGQSWSGQFPFRKRSGEGFMATVTKSPLYEGGELSCVITVSSDAAHFNGRSLEKLRAQGKNANGIPRPQGLKRIQWQSRPQIAPIPQIASSVSSLASKVLPRRNGDNAQNAGFSGMNDTTETDDAMLEKPGKLAAKLLEKLHIKGNGNQVKENETYQQIRHNAMCIGPAHELASGPCQGSLRPVESDESLCMKTPGLAERESTDSETSAIPPRFGETSMLSSPRGCNECFHFPGSRDLLPQLHCLAHKETADRGDLNGLLLKDEVQNHDSKQRHSSGESVHSHGSSSSKGDSEVSATVCEIRWEDLKLGEEIGQGSCAVVYRGIWMGSDVAVKVYVGNDYCEDTLQVYKKEIRIMERLRHPNILLFMGAICSQERLAIVTEFLPRGSLFKALHKNNQALDMRRRLRMALDVARGMNYLHHRNPPIVHRDLKSSNLLVDRNWTVKVADFGLSRLKDATLIKTKSGRGTPQWMAPEVLRNEPSNEKSDVFSFGVVLWELMTESIPWNNLNFLQVVGVVGFMDRRLDLPVGIDPRIASLIQDCWQSEPDRRPSFEEILQRMLSFVPGAAAPSVQKDPHS